MMNCYSSADYKQRSAGFMACRGFLGWEVDNHHAWYWLSFSTVTMVVCFVGRCI